MPGARSLRRDVNTGVIAQAVAPTATEIGRGVVNWELTAMLQATRTRSVAVISHPFSCSCPSPASCLPNEPINQRAKNATENGPHDGNPRVTPVGASFAGDGEHGVGDARSEVARRIDGVSRRAAERETDGHHDHADDHGSEAF